MKSQFQILLLVLGLSACEATSSFAQVQNGHSAAGTMQLWNRTSQGMSTNAALAFYRVQNVGHPVMPAPTQPRYSPRPVVAAYPVSPYGATANTYFPTSGTATVITEKPFAYARPPATAYDRYWPYLMEGYENPETGYIIWTMP